MGRASTLAHDGRGAGSFNVRFANSKSSNTTEDLSGDEEMSRVGNEGAQPSRWG
jgi:hypothetical protein